MASLLYRLGRFSFRRRRLTAGLWMLLLIALTFGSAGLSGPTNDALSIPGTESWRALDVVAEKFGTGTATAEAKVVFTVPGAGTLADPERRTAVRAAVAELRKAPQVTEVDDPYDTKKIAPDGRTGYASVSYRVPETEVTEASRAALLAVGDSARRAGLGVEFSGDVIEEEESSSSAEGIGLLVAAVILMITFGSLVAAGLPVLTAVLGVAAGVLGISIATGFLELTSNTSALALMLGLAVGIDYALFILSRYRDELAAGHDGEEAAGRAVGTAGSAVVFAGLTVIIALIALTVVGIPFLAAMGIAAAGTVAIAVVISLSLLPALIGFAGRTVRPKARRATARTPFGERWARLVVRHRVPVMILAVAAAGVAALPALGLKLALPDAGSAPAASTQRKGYDQLAAAFGAGINGPLVILVEAPTGSAKTAGDAAQRIISGLDGVVVATPATANRANDTATLTVIPRGGPTSEDTKDLVHRIRAHQAGFTAANGGAALSVTGRAAVDIDVSEKITDALLPYLAVVVGLAFVLLMLVFRSILVPIKAALGFLLSVVASFGALVFVFQQGHLAGAIGLESAGPVVSFIPIFLVGILFGLAMDYEVFLVTRAREEFVRGAAPDDAIVSGMRHSARVVTAAALIMISVFAGFIFSTDTVIKSLGFALAFGVAFDAFLVRMTLVPAVLSLLGRSAWWLPGWLGRLLPHVDVEGSRLARPAAPATRVRAGVGS
ncbi:MMPL family transporter [Pseudosporangium ferrugineum]|uniref:RND superfamily putative drug exporter n=1 Tax=Pseudosporangium ferrugineum TaxID=439699 RepID=A0A2T0SBH9_9ACTN|nr:MMPL family transporter [Pseudosporangium ferrugineum]PRY30785.1 RND superfamily putative drug exporter [Pseudosporangium ferrugineum]